MKLSNYFLKTYKEYPSDEEIISQKLLVKAGYIKKQAQGLYIYLPLAVKVMENIKKIVREEMNAINFSELLMPCLLPQEVYENRIKNFGREMIRLTDRNNKPFCLGPTHEEPFTLVVKDALTSYKQLPICLYQINTKYRDEKRPRFGLMRAKEFIMKDAYSYHKDEQDLDVVYNKVKQAYIKIFNRVGLNCTPVLSDNGVMGGSKSEEFMAKNDIGEAELVFCRQCDYAVNLERAECFATEIPQKSKMSDKKEIHTPDTKTVDELVRFLNLNPTDFLKVVVYNADGNIVVALVRGDREINEVKLINHLKSSTLELAVAQDFETIGSVAGYVGAFNLKNCQVIADLEVKNMFNFIIGANKANYHIINANLKDIKVDAFIDLRNITKQDRCPKCNGQIEITRGIEVGHIFKNNTYYTEVLNCKFLDEFGKILPAQMGCYGIGIGRTLSAVVEQMSDQKGIILPESIAPYKLAILPVNYKDEVQVKLSEQIYNKFADIALLDDRKESFGFKLKDMELIGIPWIIIVGKDAIENKIELYNRVSGKKELIEVKNLKF